MQPAIRLSIRVQPGASRTRVGGSAGDPPRLVVKVGEQPVDGKATEAALKAIAKAFAVKNSQVLLISGHTSKDKIIQITGEESAIQERLSELLIQ